MEKQGIAYIFRLSSNDYKKERGDMASDNENVRLEHTYSRLQKIRKNHPERVDELRAKEYTDTRIINSTLVNGSLITFMTNLPRLRVASNNLTQVANRTCALRCG